MIEIFIRGLFIGIAISMPVGPISILCIQRTLFYGIKIGLLTAIGSSLADGVFGSIAAFGLTTIADFLSSYQFYIHIIGAAFLLYLGISMLRSPPHNMDREFQHSHSTAALTSQRAFISAFFMTITNPLTIFSFMALFAGLGIGSLQNGNGMHGIQSALIMLIGLMTGSSLWEFIVSILVRKIFHSRMNSTMMRVINFISGSTILAFAAFSFRF